ncbi:XdhC family protein [Clostridium sp. Marseille-Q7071]
MACGGNIEVYIKVFIPKSKLLIIGGGHIALVLQKLGNILEFHTTIFEDREEYSNYERFTDVDEIILGDIEEGLKNYNVTEECYIIIVTRGYIHDEISLRSAINLGGESPEEIAFSIICEILKIKNNGTLIYMKDEAALKNNNPYASYFTLYFVFRTSL